MTEAKKSANKRYTFHTSVDEDFGCSHGIDHRHRKENSNDDDDEVGELSQYFEKP